MIVAAIFRITTGFSPRIPLAHPEVHPAVVQEEALPGTHGGILVVLLHQAAAHLLKVALPKAAVPPGVLPPAQVGIQALMAEVRQAD